MPVSSAELRGPIETVLRRCRTVAATLGYVADTIRARTPDRDEQIDLGVLQHLGSELERGLAELEGLIEEMLGGNPEELPIVIKALDFYKDPRSYQNRRGTTPVMADAGTLAIAAVRAMKGSDAEGEAE